MKKRYIFLVVILIGASAYIISRHYPQTEQRFIEALIADGVRAIENEDTSQIEKLFAQDSPQKEKWMEEAQNYFNDYKPMDIKIQNAKYKIEEEEEAIAALFLIITAYFEELGEVKGHQTVGLELVKKQENNYRGWRINKVEFN